MSIDITITDDAVEKVKDLREEDGNDELMLRVFVTGGGCSGFSYGFDFAEEMNEDDASFSKDEVTVVIDSLSFSYLDGSVIDYVSGLEGSRFVIHNPNAVTTCGCGSSFSV